MHERSGVAQQCDGHSGGTEENLWLCYLEVRVESHKIILFNPYNVTRIFKKNSFLLRGGGGGSERFIPALARPTQLYQAD